MIPKSVMVEIPAFYDPHTTNPVGLVKAIRALTGMGLREAKALIQEPGIHSIDIKPYAHTCPRTGREFTQEESYNHYIELLKNQCIKVTVDSHREQFIANIRELATDCLARGEYDKTVDLINIIRRYS